MTSETVARPSLRPVRADDAAFLARLYASTREEELALLPWSEQQKDAFLDMQFRAQSQHYAAQFPDADFCIIERDGRAIGRLYVNRGDEELRLIDIALLPEHRGSGIGTQLLEQVLSEATASGLPVRLHVEPTNPARRLYARLGFRSTGGDAAHESMEWTPPA